MHDDPRQRGLSELWHDLESMAPSALHDATRRALLTVYTPQQAAIWLNAHATGDAKAVARKALVLCGAVPARSARPADAGGHLHLAQEGIEPAPPMEPAHLDVQAIITGAVRTLFTCEQADEVQAALLETVTRLGGRVVRAADAPEQAIPLDLSLGTGDPLLPMPDAQRPGAEEHLRTHLPQLVEDAHRALDRLERTRRLVSAAAHAGHPSLLDRRAYERLTGRISPGDVLVLLRVEGLDELDDLHGPSMSDQVLRVFGSVLREHMRIRELAVRLGGGEFLLVIEGPEASAAIPVLERLRIAWGRRRPAPVHLSAGVAPVSGHLDEALEAADRRLYGRLHGDGVRGHEPMDRDRS